MQVNIDNAIIFGSNNFPAFQKKLHLHAVTCYSFSWQVCNLKNCYFKILNMSTIELIIASFLSHDSINKLSLRHLLLKRCFSSFVMFYFLFYSYYRLATLVVIHKFNNACARQELKINIRTNSLIIHRDTLLRR